jgi:hypothetical protein
MQDVSVPSSYIIRGSSIDDIKSPPGRNSPLVYER